MSVDLSERVRFVLVRPKHPGNIGAAARAIKNMGFHRLVIVADSQPDWERAAPLATHASDLLDAATVCPTIDAALQGVVWAAGTTARPRQWRYQHLLSPQLGQEVRARAVGGDVAIIFGQEDFGLDNETLARCQAVVEIPTAGMKSLNLAQAVLVIAYDLMTSKAVTVEEREVVDLTAVEPLVQRWLEAWQAVGYMRGRSPDHFQTTLRQILGRAALDKIELDVLRGFFNKLRHYLDRTGGLDDDAA